MNTTPENQAQATVLPFSVARHKKQTQTRYRLLGLAEVESRCRTKKSAIYAGMAAGTFPKSVRLPHSRSVAWYEGDIDAWIDAVLAANGHVAADQQAGVIPVADLVTQVGAQ